MSSYMEGITLSTRWKGLPLPGQHPGRESLPEGWEGPEFDDSQWRAVRVPGLLGEQYEDTVHFSGIFLYRLKFSLPADMAGN